MNPAKTAPFCYGRFVGSNLTSNAVRETAPFSYGRFFPGHVPKKQRHFVTADFLEATSQAMLSEKQRHVVTVISFQSMCPKNSAILLRPICGKQPHKQCCYADAIACRHALSLLRCAHVNPVLTIDFLQRL